MRAAIVVAKRVIESGDRLDPTEEAQLLSQSIKFVLDQHVKQNAMTIDESKAIMTAMKKSINSILLKPQDYQAFWDSYQQKGDEESKLALLANIIKEKMKPILYDAGIIEQLKRNTLVRVLGDFIAPYRNTDQKEIGYQKLRAQYALRTVELRVGDIKTTDFDEATKAARVMDTLGYLDTINHITNHELHDPEVFNTGEFYLDIVTNFDAIYKAVLAGAGKELERDKLMQTINTLQNQLRIEGKSEEDIARNVYQLIKDKVEENLDSAQAFALSRAVEYRNGVLTAQELFKETYEEGFKRSGTFAMSNITGERILRTGSLHEALKGKDMFELYRNQSPHNGMTRTDKVFASLENLTSFRGAYETAPQVEQGKGFKSDL
ncbi:putative esterase with patatin domain [Legionella hackeliae]|nr:hypothetical protein [Legionella hackeliae]STX48950.1 putative esterase with patatin domain [Legionella hackeliae]